MAKFVPIHKFTSTFDIDRPNQDTVRGFSQLFFEGKLLPLKISSGGIFRQYQVGDRYLIVTLYDGYDYESFSFVILDDNLRLLGEHISPDFFDKETCPYEYQFLSVAPDTLKFYLGAKDPWIVQAFDRPTFFSKEAFMRIRHGWWPHLELFRMFRKGNFSIRPLRGVKDGFGV